MLSASTFGHGGLHGTQAWIDLVKGVIYLLMVQHSNFPNSDDSEVRNVFQKAAASINDKYQGVKYLETRDGATFFPLCNDASCAKAVTMGVGGFAMKGTLSDKQRRTLFAAEPAAKARETVPALLLAAMLAASSIGVLLCAAPARADYTTAINPATTWGTWQGWGCSLAWWANAFGGSQQYNAQDLAAIVFSTSSVNFDGQNLPGLGMNIARYNLGACSSATTGGSSMVASPNIHPPEQMQGYEISPNNWNWGADANQRQMLQYAKADGADYFQMFSNSPMWWMTNNDNPSGAANGGANLNLSYANSFANYIATTAQYFSQNYGITFNSVEPFNEPSSDWWKSTGGQEGCNINASTQATVISSLRTQLNTVGLNNMMIAASDENNTSLAVSTWNSFSSTTKSQVGCLDTHGYGFNSTAATQLYNASQGKQFWSSEYGDNDTSGLTVAEEIDQSFNSLHSTAWCYWQPFDGSGWGLINDSLSTSTVGGTIGSVNTKYYMLAQYTRSIREGMTILSSGDPNTVAAYDPVNHDLWLVTTNSGSAAETVDYNLENFYSAAGPVTGWCTTANGSELYQQFGGPAITGGNISLAFAASSVQTLEIQNVYLAVPSAVTWAVSAGSAPGPAPRAGRP